MQSRRPPTLGLLSPSFRGWPPSRKPMGLKQRRKDSRTPFPRKPNHRPFVRPFHFTPGIHIAKRPEDNDAPRYEALPDSAAMPIHGAETSFRIPFLYLRAPDHPAFRLPPHTRLRHGRSRWIGISSAGLCPRPRLTKCRSRRSWGGWTSPGAKGMRLTLPARGLDAGSHEVVCRMSPVFHLRALDGGTAAPQFSALGCEKNSALPAPRRLLEHFQNVMPRAGTPLSRIELSRKKPWKTDCLSMLNRAGPRFPQPNRRGSHRQTSLLGTVFPWREW